MNASEDFTTDQKQYLHGFAAGSALGDSLRGVPTFADTLGIAPEQLPGGPELCRYPVPADSSTDGQH